MHWGDKSAQASPIGLELTEELVERLVEVNSLGARKATDILAISFSSHDYAGHIFGPTSPAMEEMTVAEDRILSKLFNFLSKKIPGGLKNVLIVLTADHGVGLNPELAKTNRIPAGRIDESALKDELEKVLVKKFGPTKAPWTVQIKEMNVFINPKSFEPSKKQEVEDTLKAELLSRPEVFYVFSETDYRKRELPPGIFEKQILNSYFPTRSGDVVAILKPYYISSDETATHQTGYSYDRTVPIVFFGQGIQPGVYTNAAEPIDIAPTISFLIGTISPSQSEGRVLTEIIGR